MLPYLSWYDIRMVKVRARLPGTPRAARRYEEDVAASRLKPLPDERCATYAKDVYHDVRLAGL